VIDKRCKCTSWWIS